MTRPAIKDWAFQAVLGSAELDEQIGEAMTEVYKGLLVFMFDGGGAAIPVGTLLEIPLLHADLTITSTTIKGMDPSSDFTSDWGITVDLLYPPSAESLPADSDTICSASPPVLAGVDRYDQNTSLTGWTTALVEGRSLAAKVDANTGHTKVALAIKTNRTSE